MKKIISFIFALYLSLSSVFALTAFASFDTTSARFVDRANLCDEESIAEINTLIAENMEKYQMDFAILTTEGIPEDVGYDDYVEEYYKENNYGYGETKDGILLLVDRKNHLYNISCYGMAKDRLPEESKSKIETAYENDTKSDGVKTYDRLFVNYLNNTAAELSKTKADGMPYWYTDDFTQDIIENRPFLVDNAEIFTDEQKAVLNEKIKAVTEKHGIHYVLFTDTDNHGKDKSDYAADFAHYFGYGKDYCSGVVVFYLSLEPDNRGYRTLGLNPYQADITPYVIDQLEDEIYVDTRTDKYYEAFLTHIDFIDRLYNGEIAKERDKRKDEANTRNALMYVFVPLAVLIGGIMNYQRQKKKMFIIPPISASNYVVEGSYHQRRNEEHYLYTTRTRTRKESDSDSSSGDSSYSSGSSSGESYSGGGSDF